MPGQSLGHGDPFLLGLVRQHRPADRIADRVDAWDVGGKAVIDHDPALAVACDADCVEPQPLGVGSPADRHQRRVGDKALALGALDRDGHAISRMADAGHPGAELELDPLARQHPLQCGRQFPVHVRDDAVEQLDDNHLGPEPLPYRAQLEPDIAAADHHEPLRHVIERQGPGRRQDAPLVDLDAG